MRAALAGVATATVAAAAGTVAAAAACAAAVWLATSPAAVRRLAASEGVPPAGCKRSGAVALAVLGAALVVGPLPALAAWACVPAGERLLRWRNAAAERARVAGALPDICEQLARLLDAGESPLDALRSVAARAPLELARVLREAAAAGALGESPADSLRRAGPYAASLSAIASSWAATVAAGAPLAPALRGVGSAMAVARAHQRAVDTELAGPRLTGWLLAALPVFGLGVAASVGTHPLPLLFGTPLGVACLAAAIVLDAVGVLWLRALARQHDR